MRSDLARYPDRAAFPASREELLETLASHQAPERLAGLVARLSADATLASFAALAEALGLPLERRPG